ncbi:MAG TPA: ribokinase [Acetobacteraceae bacterium]|nr:ribokinase [Acetobacteraceae bacterium]
MIVIFGSINLDLIFALDRLPLAGETLLGPGVVIQPGGKGANQAVAAARDGAGVAMAGAVGRDALASGALALLKQADMDLSRVAETEAATGCAAICTDKAGRNLIAVGSGANLAARAAQVEDALLGPGTTVVLQMEVPAAENAALIARARSRGARIVLNLAPALPLDPAALRAVDVLVVNEHEAAWLARQFGAAATASGLRLALGPTVVRTLGERGAEFASAEGAGSVAAFAVTAVDTTAAGDCFTGVLAAALDRGLKLTDSLLRASAAAAICCTRAGSQTTLPSAEETDRFLR